ncbi:MAG: helix-turn-helix transcriptional regulator [Bacillaceae bacterium]|nr:helix-turn-helix transcriptional regulator [Bacillaceae bacterium]
MGVNPNVSSIASLISEPSRAAILLALLDGTYRPASELAYMAGITPQTASFHLKKMLDVNVVTMQKQGRHHYYAIKNYEVAKVLESLLALAPQPEIKSLNHSEENKAIRSARTCYDHLAGNLGVQITHAMLKNGILKDGDKEFEVTDKGEAFFIRLGIDISSLKQIRRSFSHKCLDWSERQYHLAGSLGYALLNKMLEDGWINRVADTRAVKVSALGKKEIEKNFGIKL